MHILFRMVVIVLVLTNTISTSLRANTISAENMPTSSTPLLKMIVEQAQSQANEKFESPDLVNSEVLSDMSYAAYRAIRYNPEKSIWRNQRPFEVQLFHTGFLYQLPVNIHLIDWRNKPSKLAFDSERFIYGPPAEYLIEEINGDIGHAGFRLHYPLNTETYKDEFAVFQGATYFRLIGKHQNYGLSARALALNTGLPEGEEFPYFTDFWLVETDSDAFTVYGKVDSPSITGVFKFIIEPGKNTTVSAEGWMFAREDIQKLGLAPFTSMFLYGENSLNKPDDFRPEVHDSDGVTLITSNDEELWRPLDNPQRLRITSLSNDAPKAFAMLQRDIQYSSYLDSEANYHKRPGLEVVPQAGFNEGRLEVIEIPTNSETHDNIVAFWVNDEALNKGDSLYVKYQLNTEFGLQYDDMLARVKRTAQGENRLPGERRERRDLSRRFVVDFNYPDSLNGKISELEVEVSAINAQVRDPLVFSTNFDREIRTTFALVPDDDDVVVDIRMALKHKGKLVSEVWTYVYEPND